MHQTIGSTMTNTLSLIGREKSLFSADIGQHETQLINEVSQSRFLVLGGAGSIGQAV